jgi:hypothetical protein
VAFGQVLLIEIRDPIALAFDNRGFGADIAYGVRDVGIPPELDSGSFITGEEALWH